MNKGTENLRGKYGFSLGHRQVELKFLFYISLWMLVESLIPRPTFQTKCLDYEYWYGEGSGDSRNGKDGCNRACFKTVSKKQIFHSIVIKGSSSEAILPGFLVLNTFY